MTWSDDLWRFAWGDGFFFTVFNMGDLPKINGKIGKKFPNRGEGGGVPTWEIPTFSRFFLATSLMIAANEHFHLTCKSLSLSLEGQQLLLPFHYCYLFLLFSFQGAAATPASLWQSQLHSFTRDNGLRLCGSGVRAFGGCHCHCNHYLCFLSSLFLCLWPASLCRFPQQQTAKVPIILPAPDSTLQCQSLR